MVDLSLENIKFIKILANSDSLILEKSMDTATKDHFHSQISVILREYYKEKTMGKPTGWIKKFENACISEDDGKAAIACARRLGLEIY